MKTVLAESGVIFSCSGNQLGRPDVLPFLSMYNTRSSQMKCSLKIEVNSIHICCHDNPAGGKNISGITGMTMG